MKLKQICTLLVSAGLVVAANSGVATLSSLALGAMMFCSILALIIVPLTMGLIKFLDWMMSLEDFQLHVQGKGGDLEGLHDVRKGLEEHLTMTKSKLLTTVQWVLSLAWIITYAISAYPLMVAVSIAVLLMAMKFKKVTLQFCENLNCFLDKIKV